MATLSSIVHTCPIAVVAIVVGIVGSAYWRSTRSAWGMGSSAWLWGIVFGYLVALAVTYVVGALGIRGWLANSIDRTTVFPQLALFMDMAIWLVLGLDHSQPLGVSISEEARASA